MPPIADMGRNREKNQDLRPYPGLRRQIKDGRAYYLLEHQKLSKSHSLGSDKEKAIAAYNTIMQHIHKLDLSPVLQPSARAPRLSLAEVIDKFKTGHLRRWAPSTTKEHFTRLDRIRKVYGRKSFIEMGVIDCKKIVFSFQGDGRRQTKNLLSLLWDFAAGEGYCDKFMVNYPSKVNLPPKQKRQRERILTLADYKEARAKCPEWLQDAADLALITLQGRMEIISARINKNIVKRGDRRFLQFQRQKTINTTGHAVEIEIENNLAPVIKRCLERSMKMGACPFIISAPQRNTRAVRESKAHRSQVLPDYITRTWSKHTGFAFHEIRSLGRRIYENNLRDQGYTDEQIKHYICSLTGWADEKMLKLYGETDEIKYIQAKAELCL